MKHLKSINEYHRTVGFRYSEPQEKYTVSLLCIGEDINEDKIKLGLAKVSVLTYDENSVTVTPLDEETVIESPDGAVQVDAIISFNVTIYNEKEVHGIVDELSHKLKQYNIDILDFKSKEILED